MFAFATGAFASWRRGAFCVWHSRRTRYEGGRQRVNPLDSWDEEVVWQLAMCEYALTHIDDTNSTAKQLQLGFRDACEEARHSVLRLRGSLEIPALQDALRLSGTLRLELVRQLEWYKRVVASLFTGFGRFGKVTALPGESLLALIKRTHLSAQLWRPPGRAASDTLALQSKFQGRYTAEWRWDTWLQRHRDTGRTLSLRGANA